MTDADDERFAGIVYASIMDRLEAELLAARAAADPVARARRLLQAGGYTQQPLP